MENKQPIKRTKELQPASRDHHHALLLCWKIRNGLKRGVAESQIRQYVNWFFERYQLPHFELEETYMFPVLGKEHELVQQALQEHEALKLYIVNGLDTAAKLLSFADALDRHIRFEERVLFNHIQEKASPEALLQIEKFHHDVVFEENNELKFI